jgi:hypothetical protein
MARGVGRDHPSRQEGSSMMGRRDALRSGDEVDALLRCKRWHRWRAGMRKLVKRAVNKRARRIARRDDELSTAARGERCR